MCRPGSFLTLLISVFLPFAAADAAQGRDRSTFEFQLTPDDGPVLYYETQPGELILEHPPRATLFADGRFVVERPSRMKNPGRFELQLSSTETQQLVEQAARTLANAPKRQQATARLTDGGTVLVVSDPTVTRFYLELAKTRTHATHAWKPRQLHSEIESLGLRAKTDHTLSTLVELEEALSQWIRRAIGDTQGNGR